MRYLYLLFIYFLVGCTMPNDEIIKTNRIFVNPDYFKVNDILWTGKIDYDKVDPYMCFDLSSYDNVRNVIIKIVFKSYPILNSTLITNFFVSFDGVTLQETFSLNSLPQGAEIEKTFILPADNKIYFKAYTDTKIDWTAEIVFKSYFLY